MDKSSGNLVIAIDGPAGSGKSTVSKTVAKKLGLLYIDTGAMYRALTLKAIRNSIDLKDTLALTKLACSTRIDLKDEKGSLKVYLDAEDVSSAIRTPELTSNVKYVAVVPGVRREMVKSQRSMGRAHGAVLEGRDIATVVFPDADYKFYLDADLGERAKRRLTDLEGMDQDVGLEAVGKDVLKTNKSA